MSHLNPDFENMIMWVIPTNNIVVKYIVNVLTLALMSYLIKKYHPILLNIISFFDKRNSYPSIHFVVHERDSGELYYNQSFMAWMDYYIKSIQDRPNQFKIRELCTYSWDTANTADITIPDGKTEISINDFIIFEYWYKEININKSRYEHHLRISTDKKNKKRMIDLHDQITSTFVKNNNMKYEKIPHIFKFMGFLNNKLTWVERKFESSRVLNQIWFKQKREFVDRYLYFINGEENCKRKGDPWTFSGLLYGSPGCGKTSLLKALINMDAERGQISHLIIIPFNTITTPSLFSRLLWAEKINNNYIPYENRIYIFEDFDTYKLSKILMDRETYDDDSDNEKEDDDDISNNKCSKKTYEKRISLSDILNVLDGLIERNGQRIFWSTNSDIKKLDEAFTRPGRLDIKIKFDKCNYDGYKYLLEEFYEQDLPEKSKITLKDDMLSPSELKEMCRNHRTIEECIDAMNSI